jgi:hypothetical protein
MDIQFTVTDTVAGFDTAPWVSATVYVNVSDPVNPKSGVYVTVPFPFETAVPFAGAPTTATVEASTPTSSVSLETTLTVTGDPSVVAAVSFTAVGGAFTPPPTLTNRTASAQVLSVDPFAAVMVTLPDPLK